ncbi:sugar nucleotide-binding protein [uncultured Planktosalinus sp.]|uniref:sugar nucleotide-binding protein n=1 Tax=uncultured Planktosalinus sp. TaxID=1810935 RepID=UPI0030DCEFCD
MKFLVFGSEGMAGHMISTYLIEKGHTVTGFSRNNILTQHNTIIGDATNPEFVKKIIIDNDFNVIINCIGLLNQFANENQTMAVYLNSYFPHFLVSITENLKTQVIHMSTDCVFSGKKGKYTETDYTDGESFYDRSKALGEISDSKNLTLRNSIVGPDIKESGIGLLNWFMKQEGPIKGFTNALWTGLTTLELAKIMEIASINKSTGLINMVNNVSISKYDLLNLFNKHLRNDEVIIEPYEDYYVDKSLVRTNFSLDYEVPSYETMVSEMAEWMKSHKNFYPHYKI